MIFVGEITIVVSQIITVADINHVKSIFVLLESLFFTRAFAFRKSSPKNKFRRRSSSPCAQNSKFTRCVQSEGAAAGNSKTGTPWCHQTWLAVKSP